MVGNMFPGSGGREGCWHQGGTPVGPGRASEGPRTPTLGLPGSSLTRSLTHSFTHPCSPEAPPCSANGHRILDIHLLTAPGQLAREAGRPSLPRAGRQDGTCQGLRGPAPSAGWCLWDQCAVEKTKASALDRARVNPRLRHHSLSRIPLHRPLLGKVGHMHGLKWGGVGWGLHLHDSRNRRVSQSQWGGESGLRSSWLLPSLGPPVTWPPDVGLPPSLLLSQGGAPEAPGICLPSAVAVGWGRRGALWFRGHKPGHLPLEHHGQVPPLPAGS